MGEWRFSFTEIWNDCGRDWGGISFREVGNVCFEKQAAAISDRRCVLRALRNRDDPYSMYDTKASGNWYKADEPWGAYLQTDGNPAVSVQADSETGA